MDDDLATMNSWPAFTDLMVSVVLILILVVGGMHALSVADLNLPEIFEKQRQLETALQGPNTRLKETAEGGEVWSRTTPSRLLILFRRSPQFPQLQRISFSDSVLFDPDKFDLKNDGKAVLQRVGEAIRAQSSNIAEIQIHGHADSDPSSEYEDNLMLASLRANSVYRFLCSKDVRLDPVTHLMSATSFGEFSPVGRERIGKFGPEDLLRLNRTPAQKQLNRRTELLLFYGRPAGGFSQNQAVPVTAGASPARFEKEIP